jgi:hypothetical protein
MGKPSNRIAPTSGMIPWRAGCGGSRTSGSEGGPEKPTSRNAGRALRPDPYTYVRTHAGWVYAAFIIDVFSRIVVGWQISESLRSDLAIDALEMAVWNRTRAGQVLDGLIHHSDRGVHSICPFATPSASTRTTSSPQSALAGTATTTPWLKPSTASTSGN